MVIRDPVRYFVNVPLKEFAVSLCFYRPVQKYIIGGDRQDGRLFIYSRKLKPGTPDLITGRAFEVTPSYTIC